MTPTIVFSSVLLLLSRNIRGWHIAFPNNSGPVSNELRETAFQPAFILPGGIRSTDIFLSIRSDYNVRLHNSSRREKETV